MLFEFDLRRLSGEVNGIQPSGLPRQVTVARQPKAFVEGKLQVRPGSLIEFGQTSRVAADGITIAYAPTIRSISRMSWSISRSSRRMLGP